MIWRERLWFGVLFVVTLWLDVYSKHWAQDNLSAARVGESFAVCESDASGVMPMQRLRTEPVVLSKEYLEFRYAENCGAAFSFLRDATPWVRRTVFGIATVIAGITLVMMFLQNPNNPTMRTGLALIGSGAVGNLIDRIRQEYVIDFIRFHIADRWEWPTFNVADICISIGVAVLLLDSLLNKSHKAAKGASVKPEVARQ